MNQEGWNNKRILIVGMARSGLAAADLLLNVGARPVLSDGKAQIDGVEELVSRGCEARLGEKSETLLEGCDALVVSPAVPLHAPVIQKAQEMGIEVMGEMELASRLLRGTQIAITGTNGKTTTTMLTGEIMKNAGKNTYVVGNIGLPVSTVAFGSSDDDVAVIEVSSFQMETATQFHPKAAAILNLTCDHLSRHGTMECYGALKEKIICNQTGDDFLVYNADDEFCCQVASRAPAKVRPFSRTQKLKTGAWVENGQIVVDGKALCATDEILIQGPHNLENALAAAALTSGLGVPLAVIRHTLRRFKAAEHRMEPVRVVGGIEWINDSKGTNPDSTIRAIEGMNKPTVLIAGGDDKKTPFDQMARVILENPNIQRVVLIGKTAPQITEALEKVGYPHVEQAGWDLKNAVECARRALPQGGVVLFSPACASFDMFKDYEERGRIFKQLVMELTEE